MGAELRFPAPIYRDGREARCDERRHGEHRDQGTQAPHRTALEPNLALVPRPLRLALGLTPGYAGVDVGAFRVGERDRIVRRGLLGLRQPGSREQVLRAPSAAIPFADRGRDPLVQPELVP